MTTGDLSSRLASACLFSPGVFLRCKGELHCGFALRFLSCTGYFFSTFCRGQGLFCFIFVVGFSSHSMQSGSVRACVSVHSRRLRIWCGHHKHCGTGSIRCSGYAERARVIVRVSERWYRCSNVWFTCSSCFFINSQTIRSFRRRATRVRCYVNVAANRRSAQPHATTTAFNPLTAHRRHVSHRAVTPPRGMSNQQVCAVCMRTSSVLLIRRSVYSSSSSSCA